jgi:hypothetical protein
VSRADQDEVVNPMFEFALKMVVEQGEFYPFGAVLQADGQVRLMAGRMGSDRPKASQVIAMLDEGLRSQIERERPRAVGICLGVKITHPKVGQNVDALLARIEDADGEAVNVYLPYERNAAGGLRTGEPVGEKGKRTLYPA